ncbi:unnamed protein product [Caenorhabditis auriculariae]|uniref:Protein kinase domain-containing protein n=1 Tax=Caenorhabditis auriculariae TaxID=2777116 RepID=A0A8S1H054_9PELO|nr:unnamed protein product [Caenorhabditis auriculariae]
MARGTVQTVVMKFMRQNSPCFGNQPECEKGGSMRCIMHEWLCDGHPDCDHGEDESDCDSDSTDSFSKMIDLSKIVENTKESTQVVPLEIVEAKCLYGEFRCPEGNCIKKDEVCNGVRNCRGGSDEELCGEMFTSSRTQERVQTTNSSKIRPDDFKAETTTRDILSSGMTSTTTTRATTTTTFATTGKPESSKTITSTSSSTSLKTEISSTIPSTTTKTSITSTTEKKPLTAENSIKPEVTFTSNLLNALKSQEDSERQIVPVVAIDDSKSLKLAQVSRFEEKETKTTMEPVMAILFVTPVTLPNLVMSQKEEPSEAIAAHVIVLNNNQTGPENGRNLTKRMNESAEDRQNGKLKPVVFFKGVPIEPDKLSVQLLRWLKERVPENDPIRISDLERFKPIQELGNGRFGAVSKYLNVVSMVHETVKKVKMEMFDHWSQDSTKLSARLDVFIEEFRHLHKISLANDRIVNFLGLYSDVERFYVFTEYLPRGSVKERIMRDNLTEEVAIKYFCEALEALHYLHTLDPVVVHRDIKAANLLITISDSIKLANFGLVRDLAVDGFGMAVQSEITLDFRGTLLYVAPEVLNSDLGPGNRNAYGTPADVWALGCTFIEILLKYPPHFEYFGHVDEIQKELLGYAKEENGKCLPYTAEVLVPSSSKTVQHIVDSIFERNPKKRPNTAKLKQIVTNLLEKKDTEDFEFPSASTSSNDEEDPEAFGNESGRKVGVIGNAYTFETIENGAVRTVSGVSSNEPTAFRRFIIFLCYYLSRILYFGGILSRSVCYLLSFLTLGLGALCAFLLLSFFIVRFFRYLIGVYCDCDLMEPQYLIISGILIILLFALLFSCCMVALGEYKFRMANHTLRESRFFVSRPAQSARLCGVKVLPGKDRKLSVILEEEVPVTERRNINHDDYYYDAP